MQAILILAHRVKLANMELKIKSLSLYMGCFTGVAVLLIILFKILGLHHLVVLHWQAQMYTINTWIFMPGFMMYCMEATILAIRLARHWMEQISRYSVIIWHLH